MVDRVVVQLPRFVRVASVSGYFGDMAIWQYGNMAKTVNGSLWSGNVRNRINAARWEESW